jgi:hypothetical protein
MRGWYHRVSCIVKGKKKRRKNERSEGWGTLTTMALVLALV